MAKKMCNRYSGIGGQAVLEGVMMKNEEKYAVAVRKPNGEIAIEMEHHQGVLSDSKLTKIPFIRGTFQFIDSMILGMKCLNFSASFYEDEDEDEDFAEPVDGTAKKAKKQKSQRGEQLVSVLITCLSIALAMGLFIVLPYYLSSKVGEMIRNDSLMAIIEGGIRILVFVLYVLAISAMKDIRRLFRYHGAEHKCINCIENGKPLTVFNVMRSSRLHKRCGTSFLFFVMFVSIILFFFIRVESPVLRVGLRILLLPVVAGISYEIIRLAGKSNNIFVRILSVPGMLIQRLTTKEPDRAMVEVAITSVEAVFDWKKYLSDNFGYVEGEESEEYVLDSDDYDETREYMVEENEVYDESREYIGVENDVYDEKREYVGTQAYDDYGYVDLDTLEQESAPAQTGESAQAEMPVQE